jgi:hypothetical protein
MELCVHCTQPVGDDALSAPDGGMLLHPGCLAGAAASEAIVGLLGLAATFLAPALIVWAG